MFVSSPNVCFSYLQQGSLERLDQRAEQSPASRKLGGAPPVVVSLDKTLTSITGYYYFKFSIEAVWLSTKN